MSRRTGGIVRTEKTVTTHGLKVRTSLRHVREEANPERPPSPPRDSLQETWGVLKEVEDLLRRHTAVRETAAEQPVFLHLVKLKELERTGKLTDKQKELYSKAAREALRLVQELVAAPLKKAKLSESATWRAHIELIIKHAAINSAGKNREVPRKFGAYKFRLTH